MGRRGVRITGSGLTAATGIATAAPMPRQGFDGRTWIAAPANPLFQDMDLLSTHR